MDAGHANNSDREKRALLIAAALHDESGTIEEVLIKIKERFEIEPYELYLRILVHLQWIDRNQMWEDSEQPNWPDLLRFLADEIEGRASEIGA